MDGLLQLLRSNAIWDVGNHSIERTSGGQHLGRQEGRGGLRFPALEPRSLWTLLGLDGRAFWKTDEFGHLACHLTEVICLQYYWPVGNIP